MQISICVEILHELFNALSMNSQEVQETFCNEETVDHYSRAAQRIGLWLSEEKIFRQVFPPETRLLEIGCGAGRISFGLWELGYRNLLGIDYAKPMIQEARRLTKILEYGTHFHVGDATQLAFDDESFAGAIFGFNGLMQIPSAAMREKAMQEVYRVLTPGAFFVFTTHDRELPKSKNYWEKERLLWRKEKQDPALGEFGDRVADMEHGLSFMHVPTRDEVIALAKKAGFRMEADVLRSVIANEPVDVREFSDECRFWVVQKPA